MLVGLGLLCAVALPAAAEVRLASIFGADMVLQRDMPVPIWGVASPGEKVTVEFAGKTATATAVGDGTWRVALPAMKATSAPRTLTVTGAGEPLAVEGVLVGEVWLALMNSPVLRYRSEGPVPYPANRTIQPGRKRHHSNVPRATYAAAGAGPAWGGAESNQHDILTTAFSNRLAEKLGVPVGIVRVWVANSAAAAPLAGLRAVSGLRKMADRVEVWYPGTSRGAKAHAKWRRQMKAWTVSLRKGLEAGADVTPSQPPLLPGPAAGDATEPTVIYNGSIHPITPLALRGVIHTHTGADAGDPLYTAKMRALIVGLRRAFGQADMPFCMLQTGQPGVYELDMFGADHSPAAWAGHRERQRRALSIPNTGLVVTADLGYHAADIGRRVARWALAGPYRQGGARSGPLYKRRRVRGNTVIIDFDHLGGGLMAARKKMAAPPAQRADGRLSFFAIAGADKQWRRGTATIKGNRVIVASDKIAKPVAVRYAYQVEPRGLSLYSRAGLPASPFRTDHWKDAGLGELFEAYRGRSPAALTALLGYPGDIASLAAAKALAAKGPAALGVAESLLKDDDPDLRCGGLRTLGWLYWLGEVERRRYHGTEPQPVTPAIEAALKRIAAAAKDDDYWVRYCAAEALGLIGAEDPLTVATIKALAVDEEPLVRCAALKVTKFRLKKASHCMAIAEAVLAQKPFEDHDTVARALGQINRYHYWAGVKVDLALISRYMREMDIGRVGGGGLYSLGNTLRRMDLLSRPDIFPGVLNLYALGCRNYMLYGVERWIAVPANVPAIRKKIEQLKGRIDRLGRDKPIDWLDRKRRFEDAIPALEQLLRKIEKAAAK